MSFETHFLHIAKDQIIQKHIKSKIKGVECNFFFNKGDSNDKSSILLSLMSDVIRNANTTSRKHKLQYHSIPR